MGKLEMPMPDLGKGASSLDAQAKALEKRIRAQMPKDLAESVRVRTVRTKERSVLEIVFDDRAEQMVLVAIEYPKGSGREECAEPGEKSGSC